MSSSNQQKCPTLKREGVHLNQSGYSPKEHRCALPLKRRNEVKNLCLACPFERCVYEYETAKVG